MNIIVLISFILAVAIIYFIVTNKKPTQGEPAKPYHPPYPEHGSLDPEPGPPGSVTPNPHHPNPEALPSNLKSDHKST